MVVTVVMWSTIKGSFPCIPLVLLYDKDCIHFDILVKIHKLAVNSAGYSIAVCS